MIVYGISKFDSLKGFSYCFDDCFGAWDNGLLQVLRIRHGNVYGRYSLDRCVQVEKCIGLMDTCSDLCAYSASWKAVLNSHESAGFLDAFDDSFSVQGFDGS